MRLVVTRPQLDGERTAAALRARGHDVLLAPLMRVVPLPVEIAGDWGAIILTSANAANTIAQNAAHKALCKLPVFAVGQHSAEAAREVGFVDVTSAGGDVRDLVRLIAERRPDARAPLLYLAGEDRAADLISELAMRGIAAEMAVVYRVVTAQFSPALTAALTHGQVDAVLHFSRRSAENFVAGATAAGVTAEAFKVRHVCLSPPVAAPLANAGAVRITVAPRPDEAALIDTLDQAQA